MSDPRPPGDAPAESERPPAVDRDRWPYRMKDLCERTGLPRQAIHFYFQQGLLPPPHKAGRNMAYYSEEHVERVLLVRRLQHERFLPLRAIRALLEDRDDAFTTDQRRLLGGLRASLGATLAPRAAGTEPLAEVLARLGLDAADITGFVTAGLLATAPGDGGDVIARDDVWLLESYAALRRVGFTRELGFDSRDLALYDSTIASLLQREIQLLATRLNQLPPERIASMLQGALPIINDLLSHLHIRRVRNLIETL